MCNGEEGIEPQNVSDYKAFELLWASSAGEAQGLGYSSGGNGFPRPLPLCQKCLFYTLLHWQLHWHGAWQAKE